VTSVYQVAVPASLLREVGLDKGSEVYFLVSDAEPNAICIVPASRVGLRVDVLGPA